ncbi:ABC transporter ATP-binding protein [Holzapfeliella floricola]|nr:ABC transporter ATP-binding protein [Holzapfeliella floricola]
MSYIEFNQVSKLYGYGVNQVQALDNLSFKLEKGEFLGIMGPSGSGKSTVLNLLAQIDYLSFGKITMDGTDLRDFSDGQRAKNRQKKMGIIFQDPNLLSSLTVKENIELSLLALRVNRKDVEEKVFDIANRLNIESLLDQNVFDLSPGQQQKVSAARAIIKEPELILADEPTGSLDSKSATYLLQFLTQLNREHHSLVMVTHDPFAASYCDRIIFVKDGRLFAQINRVDSRQAFFESIVEMQATVGGGEGYDF